MKKERPKLTEVKAEEPEVIQRLVIGWHKDGSAQISTEPQCRTYEILGLLVSLIRQLGG